MIASSVWADRVANYVRDVAVSRRPWWKVRLRGAVPETYWCKRGVSLVSGMIGGIV